MPLLYLVKWHGNYTETGGPEQGQPLKKSAKLFARITQANFLGSTENRIWEMEIKALKAYEIGCRSQFHFLCLVFCRNIPALVQTQWIYFAAVQLKIRLVGSSNISFDKCNQLYFGLIYSGKVPCNPPLKNLILIQVNI